MQQLSRVYYLDCLRILATLFVIVIHIVGGDWYIASVNSYEWNMLNFYESCVCCAVPIFQMITGALFLGRDIDPRVMIFKYVKRIVVAFISWSLIYSVFIYIRGEGIRSAIAQFITGYTHMWFLFMIAGIYTIMPFLRIIAKNRKLFKYFLCLSFLFTILFPAILNIITWIHEGVGEVVEEAYNNVDFHFAYGNIFYVILGYYLSITEVSKKQERIIYVLGAGGFFFILIATALISIHNMEPYIGFYQPFTIAVMLEAISIFVFTKKHLTLVNSNEQIKYWIFKLSKYSFGVYLVHMLVICIFIYYIKFTSLTINPIISVPIKLLLVASFSYIISAVLHKIPILRKYIV